MSRSAVLPSFSATIPNYKFGTGANNPDGSPVLDMTASNVADAGASAAWSFLSYNSILYLDPSQGVASGTPGSPGSAVTWATADNETIVTYRTGGEVDLTSVGGTHKMLEIASAQPLGTSTTMDQAVVFSTSIGLSNVIAPATSGSVQVDNTAAVTFNALGSASYTSSLPSWTFVLDMPFASNLTSGGVTRATITPSSALGSTFTIGADSGNLNTQALLLTGSDGNPAAVTIDLSSATVELARWMSSLPGFYGPTGTDFTDLARWSLDGVATRLTTTGESGATIAVSHTSLTADPTAGVTAADDSGSPVSVASGVYATGTTTPNAAYVENSLTHYTVSTSMRSSTATIDARAATLGTGALVTVVGGAAALNLTATNAEVDLNAGFATGAATLTGTGTSTFLVYTGAQTVDYALDANARFVMRTANGRDATINITGHGTGNPAFGNVEVDIAGNAGTTETINDRSSDDHLTLFGGVADASYTGGNGLLIYNGANQTGTLTVTGLPGSHNRVGGESNFVWAGSHTVYHAAGKMEIVVGSNPGQSGRVDITGGTLANDYTQIDSWGTAGQRNVIDNEGASDTLLYGGRGDIDYTGRNTLMILDGFANDTNLAALGNDVVWAGAGRLDMRASYGDDTVVGGTGTMAIDASASVAGHLETYLGYFAGNARMSFIGGGADEKIVLGNEQSSGIIAGTGHMDLTGGSASAYIDLTKASSGDLSFAGSVMGNADIHGFDSNTSALSVTDVAKSAVSGGNLVISMTDGHTLTLYGVTSAAGLHLG